MKYVSDSNLSKFLQKLKGIFAKKSEAISQDDADIRYLQLSGGTMTGSIKREGAFWKTETDTGRVYAEATVGSITIGSNQTANDDVRIRTGASSDVYHQKGSALKIMLDEDNTAANPTLAGTEAALESLKLNGTSYKNQPSSISYSTTTPTAANTDGVKIVVLSSEPATRYDGWLYIILGS